MTDLSATSNIIKLSESEADADAESVDGKMLGKTPPPQLLLLT